MPDRPERLQDLAVGLDLALADLYAFASIRVPTGLPSLPAYLYQRYGDRLPEDALDEICRQADVIASRYGTTLSST